eukprot:TRINITY_DN2934_c0_g4_i1.p1 TRINITY_DN2934_c0_g4~~TRINITY_DN2934_c0_g4_i1.p1  ORF type:complete len:765 (+),score=230.89 TRINITY_DN2934_c0_g4_i1:147-2441(+)
MALLSPASMQLSSLLLLLLLSAISPSTSMLMQSHNRRTEKESVMEKVVRLLQEMKAEVTDEGDEEEKSWKKYKCYCDDSIKKCTQGIEDDEKTLPQLSNQILQTTASKARLDADKEQAVKDKVEAEAAIKDGTEMREKEAKAFAEKKEDDEATWKSLGRALAALKNGQKATGKKKEEEKELFLLQRSVSTMMSSDDLDRLAEYISDADISPGDRDTISAIFIQKTEVDLQEPGSLDYIVGVVEQMAEGKKDELTKDAKAEQEKIAAFTAMKEAKNNQIKALTDEIKAKTEAAAEVGVNAANLQEDYDDLQKSMKADIKFLAELKASCRERQQAWDKRKLTRGQELQAIGECIELLSGDNANMISNRAGNPKALVQVSEGAALSFFQLKAEHGDDQEKRNQAAQAIQAIGQTDDSNDQRLSLLALAVQSNAVNFGKVLRMIQDMIGVLKDEQGTEDQKKKTCEEDMEKNKEEKEELEKETKSLQSARDDIKSTLDDLKTEVIKLTREIKTLDDSLKDATDLRKKGNEEYKKGLLEGNQAINLLEMAKAKLKRFYQSSFVQEQGMARLRARLNAATEAVARAGDGLRIANEQAEEVEPSLVQVSEDESSESTDATDQQVRPKLEDAPEDVTKSTYSKKTTKSNGVISLITKLENEVKGTLEDLESGEKKAQEEYEETTKDARDSRTAKVATLAQKEGEKGGIEARLVDNTRRQKENRKATRQNTRMGDILVKECKFLVDNYDVRKKARTTEIDGLISAKKIFADAT